ncbi:S8 family serine peptidase [Mesorhizobium newzealandense]|uniref:S8 family serine peptidase n=1 Tax=Mesorhizobium newzealandense TaxID=1300302 RepID=A0ABW4UH20_9HYPH
MLRRYAIIEVNDQLRSLGASPKAAGQQAGEKFKLHTAELNEREVLDTRQDPNVADLGLVMPTRLIAPVSKLGLPADAAPATQWGISAVGADRIKLDGSGVVVAVLDTGIDKTHPSFLDSVNIVEEDFSGSGNGDSNGHGTHCAGTIFGKDLDGRRIGIARNIRKALIGKVFADGEGDSFAIFKAMQWAAREGANIISMSLGFDFPGMIHDLEKDQYPTDLAISIALEHFKDNLRVYDSMMRLIEAGQAFGRGPMVVAAAGNESRRGEDARFRISASLPSAAEGMVSVAAVRKAQDGFEIADFSNGRAKICAPGENIVSAGLKGGLATMSGTSMACPHVAGVAALWWQAIAASKVRATAESVTIRLLGSASVDKLPNFDPGDAEYGLAIAPP